MENKSKILKSFGNRVKKLRKAKNISQEELGERANLHYTYIGGVERGERNVSLESIEKIAKGLDVNIGELFPFVSRKEKMSEEDSLKNEIIDVLYDYDAKTLKLLFKIVKDVKDWIEAKD